MREEADFSNFIHNLLIDKKIPAELEGTKNIELAAALRTASKSQTGKSGYPDHIAVVNDFVLVMEDKADQNRLELQDGDTYSMTPDATKNYAVNGAIFYAKKILTGSSYKKIFAFGNAGDRKRHRFKPVFIDVDTVKPLPDVQTFVNFNAENIDDYYNRAVLGKKTRAELELKKIVDQAAKLHEILRNYGQLRETEKPLVVSAILLALAQKDFFISQLIGDETSNDGEKILNAVENALKRANVGEKKISSVLDQFRFIKNRPIINALNENLDAEEKIAKSPLKYFTEYIDKNIYQRVMNSNSPVDYLGIFYREFVSYSGGDGQTLGVVLTPPHITELFCDLVDLKAGDIVLDPCCGTASFLLATLDRMLKLAGNDENLRDHIKRHQLHGIEIRDDMFSIATTSMILRGDGKSNLTCGDFFAKDAETLQAEIGATVGFMNPPYSQAKNDATKHLSELRFIEHLLNSVKPGARVAVIVPVSAMIGKTKDDKIIKREILSKHTLKGVISLSKNTFYQIGVVPCIAVFAAGEPHFGRRAKFINFEDDGWELKKHEGYVPTPRAKDRRQFLLDCWRDRLNLVPSSFMVETTVDPDDEWLHSFYYYNDELPAEADFLNTIADYLTFEFNMIVHGRAYLFDGVKKNTPTITEEAPPLDSKTWKDFVIGDLFRLEAGKCSQANQLQKSDTGIPYIGATNRNNGVLDFVNPVKNFISRGNSIAFVCDGEGSMGYSFYKAEDSIATTNIIFGYSSKLNRFNAFFITTVADKVRGKYNYNYKRRLLRLQNERVMLPVNDAGAPDFDYMEKYICQREQRLLQQYLESIAPPQYVDGGIVPLNEKNWREFRLLDYFNFVKGDQNNMAELKAGTMPLVSAKNTNNGYKDFVAQNEKKIFGGNCLTINNDGDGGAGISYYQPTDFLLDTHVTALFPKIKMTPESLLFIAQSITIQREKFGHGYSLNNKRLNVFRVMLPVNDAGAPDFEYMENYTRWHVAQILSKYAKYRAENSRGSFFLKELP